MTIFRKAVLLLHLVILFLLFGTMLNAVVPPSVFPFFNLLSLAFVPLLIVHLFFSLIWILSKKKRAFIFLVATLLLIVPIRRWINMANADNLKPDIKILTLNAHGGKSGKDRINIYIEGQNPDIVLGQETANSILLEDYPYQFSVPTKLVVLHSKHKIIDSGELSSIENGKSLYADIDVDGVIIRVINVYLNPFSFSKQKVKPSDDLETNKQKSLYILGRLIPNFKVHEAEIKEIRKAVESSPYPVIVAGDFNAVPNSYEYYQLSKGLQDAFVRTGKGSGTTFHDYKIPIRIDYVFASDSLEPVSYSIDRSVKLSDHYPVTAEFRINK